MSDNFLEKLIKIQAFFKGYKIRRIIKESRIDFEKIYYNIEKKEINQNIWDDKNLATYPKIDKICLKENLKEELNILKNNLQTINIKIKKRKAEIRIELMKELEN